MIICHDCDSHHTIFCFYDCFPSFILFVCFLWLIRCKHFDPIFNRIKHQISISQNKSSNSSSSKPSKIFSKLSTCTSWSLFLSFLFGENTGVLWFRINLQCDICRIKLCSTDGWICSICFRFARFHWCKLGFLSHQNFSLPIIYHLIISLFVTKIIISLPTKS